MPLSKSGQPKEEQLLSTIEELKQQHEADQRKIAGLMAQRERLVQMLFGPRTETRKSLYKDDGDSPMMNLFNEAETEADPSMKEHADEETETTEVKAHKRKKRSLKARKELLKNVEHQKVVHDLSEEEKQCRTCGTPLSPIGEKFLRSEIIYHPATLEVIDHYVKTYECRVCRGKDRPHIVEPQVGRPVISHSYASPSALAHVMAQKYIFAVPLYRQEKEWEQLKVSLPRNVLANWIICASRNWLIPLTSLMRKILASQPSVHVDETPVQVHREKDRKNTTKSYMWVYTSGKYEKEKPIILFDYQPGRSGDHAVEFLKDFQGYFHTDDFSGYGKLKQQDKHCLCWAHARRKFVDCKTSGISSYDGTVVQKAIDQIAGIYKIESHLNDVPAETRKAIRERDEKPLVDKLFEWAKEIYPQVMPRTKLGTALGYLLSNKEALTRYLENGICEIDNNMAENSIRPFTVGRKNWLFSDSPKGAKASAAAYSIIETCKANGVNPEKYLIYLFTKLPNEEWPERESTLMKYLPWNPAIKEACK